MEGYNADQKTQDFLNYTKYQVKPFYSEASSKVKMRKETVKLRKITTLLVYLLN